MKKITKYLAEDETEFSTRNEVITYETNLMRKKLVTKFLLDGLEVQDVASPVALSKVIDVICADPKNFTITLSARYARTMASLPGPKRTLKKKPKQVARPNHVLRSTQSAEENRRSA